jgi:hypothetical protein
MAPNTIRSILVTLLNQFNGAILKSRFPQIFPITNAGIKIIDRKTVCSEYDPLIISPPTRKHIPMPIVKIIFAR